MTTRTVPDQARLYCPGDPGEVTVITRALFPGELDVPTLTTDVLEHRPHPGLWRLIWWVLLWVVLAGIVVAVCGAVVVIAHPALAGAAP
jgi:hypothetical protein